MDNGRAGTRNERDYGLSFTDALRDCLNAAVITVNQDQVVTTFNSQAEKLTHLCANQVLNHSVQRLPPELRKLAQKTLKSGTPVQDREMSLGEGALRVSAFPGKKRGKGGVTVIVNDLGPVQKLEGNMRQLDRLASVGALSASMAHEIKNALVAVRTFVDVLIKENKDAELADIVSREMRRIDSIVSQMLRLAGPAKPTLASVRIHPILDHALHLVQPQLDSRKMKARREFKARSDEVLGDEYQLHQAFLNLFFNAVEAMGPGGELTVKTQMLARPRSILIGVSDTGVGIAPEDLGRLFDAFFTTKEHGTGLGLSITRRIVQEHNGSITVESKPGKGTTFHVTLPI
jgi:signal transduction histidine kinase